jgi:hypothetical protein
MTPAAWTEVQVERRTLTLAEDVMLEQSLERRPQGHWEVLSQVVENEDTASTMSGRARDLRSAKRLANKHADQLGALWREEDGR